MINQLWSIHKELRGIAHQRNNTWIALLCGYFNWTWAKNVSNSNFFSDALVKRLPPSLLGAVKTLYLYYFSQSAQWSIITLLWFTSALKVLSSSAPRAPSAHMHSARKVRLQSNQQQLFREVEAMVWARGGISRPSCWFNFDVFSFFSRSRSSFCRKILI